MKLKYSTLLLLLSFTGSHPGFAQLTVKQGAALNMTPYQLVQAKLVGQGVTISNVTFNASSTTITSNQIGSFNAFDAAYTQLKLSGGLILSSGTAAGAIGPNNTPGFTGSIPAGGGDPDLDIIASATTHDAAVLEFDFVPVADTLRFRYVFGSEEFMEYCNQYNDSFGFFLSGPGINGTFSKNSVDIAVMPGSLFGDYVTINHLCTSPFDMWVNPDGGLYYQYDGLSYVFTAWHIVQACQTYHIKIAVADAGDWAFDSGVFLEENSFTASGFVVQNKYDFPGLGQLSVEGCSDATITFHLPAAAPTNDTIRYTITGTATNGVDYTLIPDYVVVPAGMDSINLVINPFMDNIPEGTETAILNIPMLNCGGGTTYHDTILIQDNFTLTANVGIDTSICQGKSVILTAQAGGGQAPYSYLWSNGITTFQTTVTPPVGVNVYYVDILDGCSASARDSILVTVLAKPVITNTPLTSSVCSGQSPNIVLQSTPSPATFSWVATSGSPNVTGFSSTSGPAINQILFNSGLTPENVTYHVAAKVSGCEGDTAYFVVTVYPLPSPAITGPQSVCLNSTTVYATEAGMTNYTWTVSAGGSIMSGWGTKTVSVKWTGSGAQTVSVTYTDANGCNPVAPTVYNINVSLLPLPGLVGSNSLCIGSTITYTTDPAMTGYVWVVSAGGSISGGGGPNDDF
ncbi:MAG: choice-of-anchor L domain-containing protein, partial [Bacteroidetes bacterium]|nr:choice-of-anchor L domain-containing protein [Bacteroidota bacterium]